MVSSRIASLCGLVTRCPFETGLEDCPFEEIRTRGLKERMETIRRLPEEQLDELMEYHEECSCGREIRFRS